MTDIQANNEVTEASQNQNTQVEKTYTQADFDNHMAKLKGSINAKWEKKIEQLGDIDELLSLRESAKKQQEDLALKRGEFEQVLREKLSVKDSEIAKRDSVIKEYKINTPLLEAAAKHKAVNAEQIKQLLSSNVRLNDSGEVEVIDENGSLRYTENGNRYSVDNLVSDFLLNNPHFVSATPATTHTKSNVGPTGSLKVNPSKLNMNDPKDREIYKQFRKESGIA